MLILTDPTPISALTGMRARAWGAALNHGGANSYRAVFPDEAQAILQTIRLGAAVDFHGDRNAARTANNHGSMYEHLATVRAIIEKDVAAGKKAAMGAPGLVNGHWLCISPIGAVTKRGSIKVRVIHDLSYPRGGDSINEHIRKVYCPVASFGHAARAVRALGPGCLLIKLDVEAAYKQIPVRPQDWHLLGFMFEGKCYYERVLPFGLRSSCRLWDMFAAALHFLCEHLLGVRAPNYVVHYVDDFLFVVSAVDGGAAARAMLEGALRLCILLGIPMAAGKTEGPCTSLVFLGIQLDTVLMQASLPPQRLQQLNTLCMEWQSRTQASIAELQSLSGMLNFACSVVRPGRIYLRRIIAHTRHLMQLRHADGIRPLSRKAQCALTSAVQQDVAWWVEFLPKWNGQSLLYDLEWQSAPDIHLSTDACNTGYGGYYQGQWFAGAWNSEVFAAAQREQRLSMPYLELLALVLAASSFGSQWRCKKITFHCDCKAAVDAIEGQGSRNPHQMHLLHQLSLLACQHNFDFRARHIAGEANTIADELSRNGDTQLFRTRCPKGDTVSPIPAELVWPSLVPPAARSLA